MKLNLKSTIAAPADQTLNGIIGNTRHGIQVDQALDPDSNNPVANKPVSTALAALANQLGGKQDKLTAGNNITIEGTTISAAGGGIPVVEGTLNEQESTEHTLYYTIPETQTSPFIFYSSDIGYLFVDVQADMYVSISPRPYGQWYLIYGNETSIAIRPYTPTSLYSTSIQGYLPTDETTSVDITFPAIDRIRNLICEVQDRDNTKVFLKNEDSHNLGRFQTPIICKDDGTYRCWYIDGKEGDNTGELATVKCKIINMGGPTATITFED